ncbi:MAG: TolC family protein [Bacteroidales bacterium]|nr:TolC family protein [Bacteroidales bacterium]
MEIFRRLIPIVFIFSILFSFQSSGQQKKWSLEECISYAIKNNIQVKQQELNAEFNQNTLFQSWINALPTLNGAASHSYSFGRALDESTYRFTKDTTIQSNNFYLSSSITLFNGLQTQNTIKQNKYNLLVAREDVVKIKNDISLSISLAYLQILLNMELLEVSKSQLDITKQQIKRTSQLVEAGSLARGSLLEIQAQAASEELSIVNAENYLNISYLNLTQLLELEAVSDFTILVPELPVPGEDFLIEQVNLIYKDAENVLPQIKSAEYSLRSSEIGLDIARGSRSPRISLQGSYSTRYSNIRQRLSISDDEFTFPIGVVEATGQPVVSFPQRITQMGDYPFGDQFKDNLAYGLTLNLSIPIFNGWQTNTAISNSKLSVLNSRYQLQYTKNLLYKEIQQAYADAVAALKKYRATEHAVSSMEESFRYTEQKFNVGLVNSVEYNTSKNQLTRTQSDLLQAKYEFIFKTKVLEFYRGNPLTL